MTGEAKICQGTLAWFEMVGRLLGEAARQANLSPDLNVSFVERYSDGADLGGGLVQGIRLDIIWGKLAFRSGVSPHETADVVMEITAAAARELNTLRTDDPAYQQRRERFIETGDIRVQGDPSRLGGWLDVAHDPIVDHTA